jgi:gamma-glutamyltranspeptidase/glutathione hydrolase
MSMTRLHRIAYSVVAALLIGAVSAAAQAPAVVARHGMVASQEKLATRIGADILAKGGNAVDAAVAVGFALAVTHPQAGNLGGGGFMLIHLAGRNADIAIDYRETAPAAVTRETFLDARGEADPRKSRDTALAIGVPGTVAGLTLALTKYGSGKFTLAQLMAPAIAHARNGVVVEDDLADTLLRVQPRLSLWPSSRKIFLNTDSSALAQGQDLVQADLAGSLDLIAREGPNAFYDGPIGQKIVEAVRAAGGVMTREDLQRYRPVERTPLRGTYRGTTIVSMPPPSSGGVHLIEMLNILEGYRLGEMPPGDAAHVTVEAMKLAYADRAKFLGDPDQVSVPAATLTSKEYAAALRGRIGERARPAADIRPGGGMIREGDNTTHFSVVDGAGNAVANTYTLNFFYGLGLVAEGTGILLNNELDDFAVKPGAPNSYGLVGEDANAPGPGKRPLSSMTPTILLKDGRVFLVTGSPGGGRIINTVLQVITNVIDRGMTISEAVAAPRLHDQWLPDEVTAERAVPADIIRDLEARGHHVRIVPDFGSANSILATPDGLAGAADPRTRGSLAAGD